MKVVARVGNLVGFKPKPPNGFENLVEVDLLLSFGIRVVKSKVAMSLMMLGESEIDGDGFRMANL